MISGEFVAHLTPTTIGSSRCHLLLPFKHEQSLILPSKARQRRLHNLLPLRHLPCHPLIDQLSLEPRKSVPVLRSSDHDSGTLIRIQDCRSEARRDLRIYQQQNRVLSPTASTLRRKLRRREKLRTIRFDSIADPHCPPQTVSVINRMHCQAMPAEHVRPVAIPAANVQDCSGFTCELLHNLESFERRAQTAEVVVENGQDVMTLLDVYGGGVRTTPFEVLASPGPYVVVRVDVSGFELGDGEGCGQDTEGEEVRGYGGSKRAFFGIRG